MENKATTFEKGLNKDASPIKQPKSTYRFALNSVLETSTGNISDVSSEEGNVICSELNEGDIIKGFVILDDNSKVLFIKNTITDTNTIYLEDTNCKLTTVMSSACFGWDDSLRIDAQYRLYKGCERVIYFTDGDNPIYRINLDSLIDYVPSSVINDNTIPSNSDKINYTNANDAWECNLFRLDRDELYPSIDIESIRNSGGSLEVGTYQFAIRYLDNDLNPTQWLFITNPVPIVFQNTNTNYFNIRGGIAGDGTTESTGGDQNLPPTNKSINLLISNIDTRYSYYQLAVLQSTDTINKTSQVYIKPEVNITSDIDEYLFVGKNSNEDIAATLEEILAQRASIYTAKHLHQNNNRLILSNVSDKNYDWSRFQIKASQIGSKYVTEALEKEVYTESVKSDKGYYYNRTYMRDEVYAFAIVWVFKNGQESPAFHIPGRPINWNPVNNTSLPSDWDTEIIEPQEDSAPNIVNFRFLPEDEQESHVRWRSYNTAYSFGDGTGLMSYYQIDNVYPDIRDCNGNSIWGVDIKGDELANRKIRHHKFPNSALEKYQDWDNIYPIGVEFFNIESPEEYANDIQGYYIVREQRTEVNKTIYDKGILDNTLRLTGEDRWIYLRSGTTLDNNGSFADFELKVFHSPRTYINRDFLRGNYLNIEGGWSTFLNQTLSTRVSQWTGQNSEVEALVMWHDFDSPNFASDYFVSTRLISEARYCDRMPGRVNDNEPVRVEIDGKAFFNYLASTHVYLNAIHADLVTFHMIYASNKVYKDVYTNLFNLKYIKTHSNIISSSTSNSGSVYGGDTFISKMDITFQDFDVSRTLLTAYVESEINMDLRHGTDDVIIGEVFTGDFFAFGATNPLSNLSMDIDTYMFRHQAEDLQEYIESGVTARDFVCEDPLEYNIDFSRTNDQRVYFPIPNGYDYCSDCINEYPYRIYYSERSFQEETVDNYLAILPNNYSDIMGDQGPITNMFVDKDRLFVHSNKALWNIQTRPNEISTTENTIFVGAGDFLSIPPRKIISTDYGYGGSNQKWATVTTEHGTFFCDSNQGKVFLFGSSFEEISANGMMSFFEQNLSIGFVNKFKELTNKSFPNIDGINSSSVGIIATYDPRYKRYILHKKDYDFTEEYMQLFAGILSHDEALNTNVFNNTILYFEPTDKKFYIKSPSFLEPQQIDFNNKEVFVNKSWTLSYNTFFKCWVSFHSYMPNIMYNDAQTYFSFVNKSRYTWKHSAHNYNTYYNYKHPMIIEYVESSNPAVEKIYGSIYYVSEVKKYLAEHKSYIELSNTTFDKFFCYTRDQITSTNNIVLKSQSPYSTISSDTQVSYASRVDNSFRLSKNIKDIAINRNIEPLLTSSWSEQEYFESFNVDGLGNGYIDVVPNSNARDINKNVYERANMKDKYMIVRLFFNSEEPLLMSLQFSNNFVIQKIR